MKRTTAAKRKRSKVESARSSLPAVLSQAATLLAAAAPKPAPKPVRVRVIALPGETGAEAIARATMHPAACAALTLAEFDRDAGELDIVALMTEVISRCERAVDGDLAGVAGDLLIAQVVTLDRTFNKLLRRAMTTQDRELLSIALRTQGACRESLESLALIKHPKVSFSQTNIAGGHQQINNGIPPLRYGARAELDAEAASVRTLPPPRKTNGSGEGPH